MHSKKFWLYQILISIMFTVSVNAQTNSDTWKLLGEQNSVKVLYALDKCTSDTTLKLMIENNNNLGAQVEFILETNHIENVTNETLIDLLTERNSNLIVDCRDEAASTIFSLPILDTEHFDCVIRDLTISLQQ